MLSQTPVLFVDEVEPCLGIWETLGFERTMEVPEGDRIGFVAMERGGVQIMYQSRASVAGDLPMLAEGPYTREGLSLFIRVDNLDDVIERLRGARVEELFPERRTFYGSREIGIRTPCATNVVFAEFGPDDE